MILYRKTSQLRIRRTSTPTPPFWAATTLAPYGPRRGSPTSIDYSDLRIVANERSEVSVVGAVEDELERMRAPLREPILIDATEFAEVVFRRGDEALQACARRGLEATILVSTLGSLTDTASDSRAIVATWPIDFRRLEELFAQARKSFASWGVFVPVIYPVTTDLKALDGVVDLAAANGATFVSAAAMEVDATAKHLMARSLTLDDDDETYGILFHADLDAVHVATERHIAALAAERGLLDSTLSFEGDRSNWSAAALLFLTASRMIAMEDDVELAGTLTRAARIVTDLEKPLQQIAAAASLSIVEPLDEVSADILAEWLDRGESTFVERVNRKWRLRRDHGIGGER